MAKELVTDELWEVIEPHLPEEPPNDGRPCIDSSEKLGRYRRAVERTLSWVNRFLRLKVRYERRADIHQAFLDLGCALIGWRYVQRLSQAH
jgi:transposase